MKDYLPKSAEDYYRIRRNAGRNSALWWLAMFVAVIWIGFVLTNHAEDRWLWLPYGLFAFATVIKLALSVKRWWYYHKNPFALPTD